MANPNSLRLFLDSVIFTEIEQFAWLIDGVTTTPTFFKRENVNYDEFILHLRTKYPQLEVHVEALGKTNDETRKEIKKITKQGWYDKNKVVLKIPVSEENLNLVKEYSQQGVRFNVHLIFTPEQAALAALAGGEFVCPLLGRYADELTKQKKLTESERNGLSLSLLRDVKLAAFNCNSNTKVMASSIRTVADLRNAIQEKADVVTVPTKILTSTFSHDMTSQGIKTFLTDMGY